MKNAIFLFFFVSLFVCFSSCKTTVEIPGVDFDVTFKATYDGNQLEKNKDYFFGTFPLLVVRYRLYLSDITLLKDTGEEVRISDVEYLDFTPDSGSSDLTATPKVTFKNVPEGEYTGIRLGFGVRPDLNAKKPSDFASGHPLSNEADYWAGWKSYIFSVMDGKADPNGDGTKDLSYSYHCGSDAVYKIFSFTNHIHVAQGHPGIGIEFDVRKLLTNDDGSMYDMVANPVTSNSVTDVRVALAIMNNYEKATTIKQ